MRARFAAFGEIAGSMIAVSAFAAAAAIIVLAYYDRSEIVTETIGDRLELDRLRASEQIAVSRVSCHNNTGVNFVLTNYGSVDFFTGNAQHFEINDTSDSLVPVTVKYQRDYGEAASEDVTLLPGESAIARASSPSCLPLILITETRDYVRVQ